MKYIILAFAMALAIFFLSCSKTNVEPAADFTGDSEFQFQTLKAEHDTISLSGQTEITAEATGKNLQYFWSATQGVITGNGKTVVYYVCHTLTDKITCMVKDSRGKSLTKNIYVTVTWP